MKVISFCFICVSVCFLPVFTSACAAEMVTRPDTTVSPENMPLLLEKPYLPSGRDPLAGAGDTSQDLTLSGVVERGLKLHPEVQAQAAEVEAALMEIDIAKGSYWPSLQCTIGMEDPFSPALAYDIVLSQMLFDWGRVSSTVDVAIAKQYQQVQSLLMTRNDVALDIIEVCFNIQAAHQQLAAVTVYRTKLQELHKLVKRRAAEGYSDSAELSRIQQSLWHNREQWSIAQGRLRNAESQYQMLLSLPADPLPNLHTPSDIFNHLTSDDALKEAITRSPRFLKAKHEMMLAQAKIDNAAAKLKPRLVLDASIQEREIGRTMVNDSSIALRLKMEPMQGLSTFKRVAAERQSLQTARWRMNTIRLDLEREFSTKKESRTALGERSAALEQQISRIDAIRETYRKQFVAGLRAIDDLIKMEREKYELAMQLVTTSNDYQRIAYSTAADLGMLTQLLAGQL